MIGADCAAAQTHAHRVGDAIKPSHPLSSLSPLPSIFPSIRVFSNESALCIGWPKYWSYSFRMGKIEDGRRRGRQRMRWLDGITDSMDMSLSQAMAESPRALLLQSQHRTRVPTPFISPASPVGEASVDSCAPDPAGDTPSMNLPTCPWGGQAVLGGFLLGDGLSLSPWTCEI